MSTHRSIISKAQTGEYQVTVSDEFALRLLNKSPEGEILIVESEKGMKVYPYSAELEESLMALDKSLEKNRGTYDELSSR